MVSSELTFSPAAKKRVRFHQDNNHANKAVMGVMQTEQIEQMGSNSESLSIFIHEDSEEYLSRAIEIPHLSLILLLPTILPIHLNHPQIHHLPHFILVM